jgi:hypothetical protein
MLTGIVQIRFYKIAWLFCLAGWAWLFFQLSLGGHTGLFSVCWIKNLTGLPCPACGTTRAVICILKGDFALAPSQNILGFPALIVLTALPVWLLTDMYTQSNSLQKAYTRFENLLKRKPLVFAFIIAIITLNWAWNLYKHL